MSYETWEALNDGAILFATIAPLFLAVVVFLQRRRRRDSDGKATGRPLVWAFCTLVFSFLGLVIVWGMAGERLFPEYWSRWEAQNEQRRAERMQENLELSAAVNLCAEHYRALATPATWDREFDVDNAVTFDVSHSANPNMRSTLPRLVASVGEADWKPFLVWIPKHGERIRLDDDGTPIGADREDPPSMCIMGFDERERSWHNINALMRDGANVQDTSLSATGASGDDSLNACMLHCNQRYTNGEYVGDRFNSCAAACRAEWP